MRIGELLRIKEGWGPYLEMETNLDRVAGLWQTCVCSDSEALHASIRQWNMYDPHFKDGNTKAEQPARGHTG